MNTDFYINIWEINNIKSPLKKRNIRNNKEMILYWDKIAKNYHQYTTSENSAHLKSFIFYILKKKEILNITSSVLDIGAGTGHYTIPFANEVKDVYAIEPSEKMIFQLEDAIKKNNINNVKLLQSTWQDIDVKLSGFKNLFDLVFTCMTPAIYDTILLISH